MCCKVVKKAGLDTRPVKSSRPERSETRDQDRDHRVSVSRPRPRPRPGKTGLETSLETETGLETYNIDRNSRKGIPHQYSARDFHLTCFSEAMFPIWTPCIVANLLSIFTTPSPPWEGGGGRNMDTRLTYYVLCPPKESKNHAVDFADYVLWGRITSAVYQSLDSMKLLTTAAFPFMVRPL